MVSRDFLRSVLKVIKKKKKKKRIELAFILSRVNQAGKIKADLPVICK